MSPTFAEITVGVIAAVLVFLFALRITPLIIDWLAQFMNRTLDEPTDGSQERNEEHHDR